MNKIKKALWCGARPRSSTFSISALKSSAVEV